VALVLNSAGNGDTQIWVCMCDACFIDDGNPETGRYQFFLQWQHATMVGEAFNRSGKWVGDE
jgi:hypothetical protein